MPKKAGVKNIKIPLGINKKLLTKILIWSNLFLLFLSFGNNDYLLKTFSEYPSKVNQTWLNNILVRSFLLKTINDLND